MNKNLQNHGIAIISLVNKYKRENVKTGETYYLLTYKLQKALTGKYFQLIEEKLETLKSNRQPLFLFNDRKKFAYSLNLGEVYFIEYTFRQKTQKTKYFHVQDWRILGDKLAVERSWNLLLKKENQH